MTASPPIRVLLVDDHTMVRRGLALFLKVFDDLLLAGEAASGEAAINWPVVCLVLLGAVAAGLASCWAAANAALRGDVLAALRWE